jgi:hypothetical protein
MVLSGGVGFRACSAVVDVLRDRFGQLSAAPTANTVQSWLLRIGLHELQRPKERADDWVLLIDHTLQLGTWKCLVMVGIRQSAWQRLERPLSHHDLTLLDLKPVQKADGDHVEERLEAVAKQVGVPLAIWLTKRPSFSSANCWPIRVGMLSSNTAGKRSLGSSKRNWATWRRPPRK